MKKNENKGFTLIEIIIAVVVLSLLLTPIVQQFSQTMATNRRAKEQQYANNEATRILEHYQGMDKNVISGMVIDNGVADLDPCMIYGVDGQKIDIKFTDEAGVEHEGVQYNAALRTETGKAGNSRAEYVKTICLDNLSTKLLAKGYRMVNVSGQNFDIDAYNESVESDVFEFVVTNEGTVVSYDEDGFVNAALVEEANNTYSVTDPNTLNVNGIRNLDSKKVALILSSATGFDSQANLDFTSQIVAIMKQKYEEGNAQATIDYLQYIGQVDNSNVLNDQELGIRKITTIKFYAYDSTGAVLTLDAQGKPTDNTKSIASYGVEVYVDYQPISVKAGTYYTKDDLSALDYLVFTQRFSISDVSSVPCAYIEYQPYSEASGNEYYVSTDYICTESYVPDAKIYLVKPDKDQAYVNSGSSTAINFFRCNSTGEHTAIVVAKTGTYEPTFYTNINKNDINGGDIPDNNLDSAASAGHIKGIREEESIDQRLYTITVTLDPTEDKYNSVSLSGAWGVN